MSAVFLFSIDLEDVRTRVPNGLQYKERVPLMTEKYLRFLSDKKSKASFFVLGETAKTYPSLIKMIADEGHELACHTYHHHPLAAQHPDEFRDDLKKNMDVLYSAGVKNIRGFRAPTFSLTEKAVWAYDVLEELGFSYSSSVLPAKNPLYGWENFGSAPKKISSKLWEIPMTLSRFGPLNIPFGGGVYFRVLPFFWIKSQFKTTFRKDQPVLGYFHPYDIDDGQEKFMHPEINENRFFNELLFFNRKNVFNRLNILCEQYSAKIITYSDYVNLHLNK